VLEAQEHIRQEGPAYVRDLELVTLEELQEIRRLWVVEKHEVEDRLPRVFEDVTGRGYPGPALDDTPIFGHEEVEILRQLATERGEAHLFPLVRELLAVEWRHRTKVRRSGLFEALESAIGKYFYEDEEDAVRRKQREKQAREAAEAGTYRRAPVDGPGAGSRVE
jgi:DNA sulfur modification protein DndC